MMQEEIGVQSYLKIHPDDNVLVALRDLKSGSHIAYGTDELVLQQDVAAKHKFFINDMKSGEEVIMYGTLVGKVQNDVSSGDLMTTSNTKHAAGHYSYKGFTHKWQQP